MGAGRWRGMQPKERGAAAVWMGMLFLGVTVVLLVLTYQTTRYITWQFDDFINLKGLAEASTPSGVLQFVFGGISGPGGRPLALLSFIANYGDWPDNPWGMVMTSLFLHVVNGLLLFLLLGRLFSRFFSKTDALLLSAFSASLWLILPINASAVLMPVQRMTILSGFFVLLTLLLFVVLRMRFAGRGGWGGLLVLGGVLLGGTVLGVFSKENAVLLPVYVALIEYVFFRDMPAPGIGWVWRWAVRLMPISVLVFLAAYFLMLWGQAQISYEFIRGYALEDRLATQFVVLWQYLRQMVVPSVSGFGPYHDGMSPLNWRMPVVWFALAGWLLLIATVVWMLRRNKQGGRVVLFSAGLYLSAHLLESTVFPLELYFEHRNYIAGIGVVVLLVYGVYFLQERLALRRAGWLVIFLFVYFLNVVVNYQVVSLWGNPLLAAEMWYQKNPDSVRAAQFLATNYRQMAFDEAALHVMDEYVEKHEDAMDVRIQALPYACEREPAGRQRERYQRVLEHIDGMRSAFSLVDWIHPLMDAVVAGKCEGLALEDMDVLLNKLMAHPSVKAVPVVKHHVAYERAMLAKEKGDAPGHAAWLKESFYAYPSLSGAQAAALALFESGENEAAIEWISEALKYAPGGANGKAWHSSLQSMQDVIRDMNRRLMEAGAI